MGGVCELCDVEGEASRGCLGVDLTLQTFTGTTREEFLKECASGAYDDIVALYRSNESTSVCWMNDPRALGPGVLTR
jgi:hypothetical protein